MGVNKSERGSVMITVAISLLMLFGVAALALDGGVAYNERRTTQSAADHAALAAAWAACNASGEAAAISAGEAAANKNGYDKTASNIDVTVTRLSSSLAQYEAVITSTEGTEFGGVVGQDEITVESRAVADCVRRVWGDGYAIFAAGGPTCTNLELDFTGSKIDVHGQVHSNGDLRVNGNTSNPSNFHDLVTYVGTETSKGVNYLGGGPDKVAAQPDPHQIDFSQFEPANYTGDLSEYFEFNTLDNGELAAYENGAGELTQSGVYYAHNEIKSLDVTMAPGVRATFVSPGPIVLSPGSSVDFYHSTGVALYSNHDIPAACDNKAIKWTGAASFEGLIYAPNGEITFSMSSGETADGAVVGYNVDVSGSGYDITWKDVTGGGPEFELEFEE